MRKITMATTAMGLALAVTPQARAQAAADATRTASSGTLQEVVVTAQKRKQNLQKASSTIVAISGKTLQAEGRTELGDIVKNIPGVTITGSDDNPGPIIIRGIGAESSGTETPSVTVFVDGVPNAGNTSVENYDLAQVEVAMGPQGSVYGGDTSGGAIALNQSEPAFKYSGQGQIGFGNYDSIRAYGMLNVPLTDQLAVRGAFLVNNHQGYLSNGLSDADVASGRVKLRYLDNGVVDAVLTGSYTHTGGHGDGTVTFIDNKLPSNAWTSTQDPNSFSYSTNSDVHAKIDWTLPFGTLSVLPNYSQVTTQARGESYGSLSKSNVLTDNESFEARLSSLSGSPLFWQGGIFFGNESTPTNQAVDYQKPGGPNPVGSYNFQYITGYNLRSIAAFGQTSYTVPFAPTVRVVGGLRWQQDSQRENFFEAAGTNEFTYSSNETDSNPKGAWHDLSWKGGLEWDVRPSSMLYFTAATGYSPGTAGYAPGTGSIVLPSQVVRTFELGAKNRFLDSRLQANFDVYLSSYTNYNTAEAVFTGIPPFFIQIVPVALTGATSNGFDGSLDYRLTSNDSIGVAVNGNWAKFGADQVASEASLDNRQFPHAPHISATPYYQHRIDLQSGASLTGRIDSSIQSPQYTDVTNNVAGYEHTHTISNVYLTYVSSDDRYTGTLYLRNLENTPALTSFTPGNSMAGVPSQGILGAPRTYGANLGVSF